MMATAKGENMGSNERQRQLKISFRVNEEEHAFIKNMASQCSSSVANYARGLSLNFEPKSTLDADAVIALSKLHGDLGRLGGLLKMWLSDTNKKGYAHELTIPDLIENIKVTQEVIRDKVKEL